MGHHFALVTNQAIDTILDQFGNLQRKRLLDVGCGTGRLSAAAAERGVRAEGIDFADKMIAIATANYPEIKFSIGDAENLPCEDDCFDCVVCSFGLLHMEQPERAMAEACPVLRSGGRYTFTVWCSPEQGCELFALILSAIQNSRRNRCRLASGPPDLSLRKRRPVSCSVDRRGLSSPSDFGSSDNLVRQHSPRRFGRFLQERCLNNNGPGTTNTRGA